MISLYIDTSTKFLCLGIAKDYQVIYKKQEIALQKQSEWTIPYLKTMLDELHLSLENIDEVCVTIGPGSFTGIRIGMCIAKVIASTSKIPLKAISALNAYANMGKKIVVLDAKAQRVYLGVYQNNEKLMDECVLPIEDVKKIIEQYPTFDVVLDAFLFNRESEEIDVIENMNRICQKQKAVENVDSLVPIYLKDR